MKRDYRLLATALLAISFSVAGAVEGMASPPAAGQIAQQRSQNAPARRQEAAAKAQAKRAEVQAKKAECGDINGDGVQNAKDAELCGCDTNADMQVSDDEKAACKAQAQAQGQAKATEVKATVDAKAAEAQSGSTTTTDTTTTQ